MTFRAELTKSAAKALRAVPKTDRRRIAKKIESLAEGPPDPAKTKMIFLYKKLLDIDSGDGIAPKRSKRRKNLPMVFTQEEVRNILTNMTGKNKLMAQLLYGCCLRLM